MQLHHVREHVPDVPIEQKTFDEHLKRARKLRWIGLEEEANQLQKDLGRASCAGSILTIPRETD